MKGYLDRFSEGKLENGEEKKYQDSIDTVLTKLTNGGFVGFVSAQDKDIPDFSCPSCRKPVQVEQGEGWEHRFCSGHYDAWERDPGRRWAETDARVFKKAAA